MPSPEFAMFLKSLKESLKTSYESVEASRDGWEAIAARFPPASDLVCTPEVADGVPVEWVTAPGAEPQRVVLYFHGGGYVMGSIQSYRELAGRLSRASAARVLLVGYRLAPEHPFPAAVDDAVTVSRWLTRRLGGLGQVVFGGDSAGGGLNLAALVSLRDARDALPAAAFFISASTDLAKTGDSIRTRAHLDPIVQLPSTVAHAKRYLGENGDPTNPLASPFYAPMDGLPPLLIMVGTHEMLYDDSARVADKARLAGVDVTLDVAEEMVHIWPFFAAILPEGREAIDRIGAFVTTHTPNDHVAASADPAAGRV